MILYDVGGGISTRYISTRAGPRLRRYMLIEKDLWRFRVIPLAFAAVWITRRMHILRFIQNGQPQDVAYRKVLKLDYSKLNVLKSPLSFAGPDVVHGVD